MKSPKDITKKITNGIIGTALPGCLFTGIAAILTRILWPDDWFFPLLVLLLLLTAITLAAVGTGKKLGQKISKPIDEITQAAESIGKGNFEINLSVATGDETEQLAAAVGHIAEVLRRLESDIDGMTAEAAQGRLDARADESAHEGQYKNIIQGFNQTFDRVAEPLSEAKEVLEKMAVNDFTCTMKGTYRGSLQQFADSVNRVVGRLKVVEGFIQDIGNGNIQEKHTEELRKIGKRSENDELIPSMLSAMHSIQRLIEESEALAQAAYEGRLDARGNAKSFSGSYGQIIEGMNRTLQAVEAPIVEASQVLQEFAKGNLTVAMAGDYHGEYNIIKTALNQTIDSLNNILSNIVSASEQVAAGSLQISDASQTLSQGASEQACSVEELNASIAEVDAHTRQNAVNAAHASELTVNTRNGAELGNDRMKSLLASMSDINDTSAQISKIIKVIDDIAHNTNILALNAAVEAARAGQYGKGFAVVAEEVRSLANQSTRAVIETTELIENSIHKVKDGFDISKDTAEIIDGITKNIEKVTGAVNDIAAASNEQAAAISQIDQGLTQVSAVIQTNSATAEESAASSEELSNQAAALKRLVEQFRLKNSIGTKLQPAKYIQ